MTEKTQTADEKYEGPSKTIEVLGKANAVGWGGSFAGLIGGGLIAALSTKEHEGMAKKGDAFIKLISNGKWSISGKWPIIIGSALVGSQLVHWASYILALGHAKPRAGKGQKQFERIKQERDALKAELESIKQERETQIGREADDSVEHGDKPASTIHAAAVENQKASQASEISF